MINGGADADPNEAPELSAYVEMGCSLSMDMREEGCGSRRLALAE